MADRFRHLFDSLKEEVVVIDRDLRILYANSAWLRRADARLPQVVGLPCHTVLLDSETECVPETCIVRQVIRSGQPAELPCQGVPSCSASSSHLISASPVLDENGDVVQVIRVTHPPTSEAIQQRAIAVQQQLAEALHRAALLANSGQGLRAVLDAILDQLHRVVDFDSASIVLLEKRGWRLIAGRGLPPELDLGNLFFPTEDQKVSWLQTHRQPLIIPDVWEDPLWHPLEETSYIRSWMGAPLLTQGRMIGTLNVDKSVPDYYHPQDAHLVMVFANQAAIAVENARLLDAERARAAQLRLLSDLGQRVLSILDPDALLEHAVSAIAQQFGYYHADVFLVDPSGQRVVFRASSDRENAVHWRGQNLSFRVGEEGIIGYVAASGEPYLARDVAQDPRYINDGLLSETRSELAMPIKVGERTIGVLDLNSDRLDNFDENDLSVTRSLADLLAVGLENARLYEAAERRVAELEAIRRASLSLTSSLELSEVLETILETGMELVGEAKDSHIFLYDGTTLRFGAALWADGRKGTPWAEPRPGGLTYAVAHSGEMIVVPDMQDHPLFEEAPASWRGAIIGLPLRMGARVVGVMNLAYWQPGHPADTELRILRLLADQAAVAIENARLFAAERQSWMRLQSIQATATALGSQLDLDSLPIRIVGEAARAFQADGVSLMLWDEDRKYLTIRASHGLSDRYARLQRISHERAYDELSVISSGDPLYIAELAEKPFGDQDLITEEGLRSVLVVPMLIHGQLTGTFSIYSKAERRRFSSAEIELARAFAAQAAVMIANAELLVAEARRRREAETLQAATQALSRSINLPEILRVILTELQKVVPYDSATVQALHGNLLKIIGGDGFPNLDELLGFEFDVTASDNPNRNVVRQRIPLIIADAPMLYEAFRHEPHAQAGIRSWLGIPLLFGDRLIGMLALDKRQPDFYTQEHARLAMAFAAQAAIAIHNARVYLEAQERLKTLTLLFDASAALSTSLDVDRVVHTIADQIRTALTAEGFAISLWERDKGTLVTLLDHSNDLESWQPESAGTVHSVDHYPATAQVLESRQPKVIQASDPEADPAEKAWMVTDGVKSLLMVPMVVRDKVVGLLELMETGKPRTFTSTEIHLCQTLANQAAAALDNARLFQETETRAREMEALVAVSRAMTTLELDDVLDSIAENALQAANTEISSVYLLDEESQVLVPRSVRGINWQELETACFLLGEGTIGQVAKTGQPLIVHDTTGEQIFVPKSGAATTIHSVLTVPLMVKKRVIGTLEVCNKVGDGEFTEADQRLLTAFADQAAIAIENARLYQEISHHLEEVQILNKVAQAATSTLDFDEVIRRGITALYGVRNFERANILLLDQDSQELWLHPALSESAILPRRADIRIPLGQGVTGRVAATGRPLRVGDVRQDPGYVAGYADSLSELAVPLRIGNRVVGVLDVQSTRPDAFSESDERLLSTLAGQMSTLLENSRLFAETQQRVRELMALMDVSRALNQAEGLETILNIVLDEAFNLIGSQEGTVILIDPPGSNRLQIVAERGMGPEKVEAFNNRPVYAHEGTYKRALRTGEMVEVPDTAADADFLEDVGSRAKSVTNIPLVAERGPIGLIAVDGLPQDDTTRRLLTALAGMAAVAIDKERLHQETANRLAEVSTLYTLSTQVTTSLSLSAVLEAIVTILRLTLDCRSCSIFLLDPSGGFLQLEAGSGPSATWKGIARLRVGEGISGRVISERRSIYIPNTQVEPDFIFFDPQIRSLLVVPLVVRNKAVGTLSIDDTQTNAFDDEVRLLTIAAAQAAVAIENAQLYESLQKSYRELEQAYEDLRELDKMKSELIQNISHELRTPLTFIKGYVELLQDGEMGTLQKEQQAALDIVSNKAEVLSRLVDDIISMQQVSSEQLRRESLSLAELGRATIRAALVNAQEAGLSLVDEISDEVPPVWGDRRRLGQVLDNLVQNAIKFSNPGGTITLRAHREEGMVRTEVKDTGIGIAADQLSRIFDRFYQVDGTTTRRFGGTGLGLAIVKQIVEAHGGQVGVESEPGQGSLFYFTIPTANVEVEKER